MQGLYLLRLFKFKEAETVFKTGIDYLRANRKETEWSVDDIMMGLDACEANLKNYNFESF